MSLLEFIEEVENLEALARNIPWSIYPGHDSFKVSLHPRKSDADFLQFSINNFPKVIEALKAADRLIEKECNTLVHRAWREKWDAEFGIHRED